MQKGQVSLEAVLVIGAVIIILISLVNLNWERFSLALDIGGAGEAKIVGELLATAINNAYANGEGFSVYLSPDALNYSRLQSTKITGAGIKLPIMIDQNTRTINISKNMSATGGTLWNITVPIIPRNISRADSTQQYPETTIRNNGTHIVIHASASNILVY